MIVIGLSWNFLKFVLFLQSLKDPSISVTYFSQGMEYLRESPIRISVSPGFILRTPDLLSFIISCRCTVKHIKD